MKFIKKDELVEILKKDETIRAIIEKIVEEHISELDVKENNDVKLTDSDNLKLIKEQEKKCKKNKSNVQTIQNNEEMQAIKNEEFVELTNRINTLEIERDNLREAKTNLEKEVTDLKAELNGLKTDSEGLKRDKSNLERNYNDIKTAWEEEKKAVQSLQVAKIKLEGLLSCRFDKAWELYKKYHVINHYYKKLLIPVFPKDEFESFVGGLFQDKNLERLWDLVKDAQEDAVIEQETLDFLWNAFTYSLDLINKTKQEPLYMVLTTKKGEKFDTYKHTLSIDSKAQGNITEVFLPGFQNVYTKKVIRKSIVRI